MAALVQAIREAQEPRTLQFSHTKAALPVHTESLSSQSEGLSWWMDNGLVKRGLEFTRRRKKWIIVVGLVGVSGYGVYKVYCLPSVERKRKRVMRLLESILSMAEMVSDSAETITVVSRDLKKFLKSDSDEIRNSLKQLSKVGRSEEFSKSSSDLPVNDCRNFKGLQGREWWG